MLLGCEVLSLKDDGYKAIETSVHFWIHHIAKSSFFSEDNTVYLSTVATLNEVFEFSSVFCTNKL